MEFAATQAQVIFEIADRNLGARNIDYIVCKALSDENKEKMEGELIKKPKIFLGLMDAVESLRKKLTSNSDADIFIDSIMNDEDLEKTFTRDEFEKVI